MLVLTVTACSTWSSVGVVGPAAFVESERPVRVRVSRTGERRVVLRDPVVRGDSLVGLADGETVRIAVADVGRLEVRRLSFFRTLALGVGTAAVAVILPPLIYGLTCHPYDC